MKQKYNHKEIEKKWAQEWFSKNIYKAEDFSERPKKMILVEFPYPSGSKLHMGHVMRYTLPEVYSRKLRMSGYNVMFPMGWDAFGLPAENYAVKTGVHPAETTRVAIETFKKLFQQMGYGVDWEREVNTTDPNYYKWTQWIFLKLWEAGLAELKEEPVWWCENLKTILANEEVLKDENGNLVAERDGKSPVERRMLKQWVLKIPKYADKLIQDLNEINFPESVKAAQINWIGRSEGAEVTFNIKPDKNVTPDKEQSNEDTGSGEQSKVTVFTTRIDTIYGASFIVMSPEHPLLDKLTTEENKSAVEIYKRQAAAKSELERTSLGKEKTGVFTGSYAINPFSGKEIPIWTSDFVVTSYGSGAIMGVPAHDDRDYEFAKKFGLEIVQVVKPSVQILEDGSLPYTGKDGELINSEEYNGFSTFDAQEKMVSKAELEGFGSRKINYKLRDWLFSRQRYWGEPIPLLHKQDGTIEAVCYTNNKEEVDKKLPVVLPDVPDYTPSSDALSPLAKNTDWVNTSAKDGTPAKRETNTMPNWAGSCWYYLRYTDPNNTETFADMRKMQYWLPVDQYFGGSEHTTLHLLYSRFWHKFLYDQGLVPTPEPYAWRMNGGILLGPDGEKMSKSRGNVINPDENIEVYGVDALRTYICFMGPYDATITWNQGGLKACRNLIDDIVDLESRVTSEIFNSPKITSAYHKMVKRVSDMLDNLKMNTAVSEFMIFINLVKKEERINIEIWKGFLKLLAPFAPFITEELWQRINGYTTFTKENSIHTQKWPVADESLINEETIIIGIQINGKIRAEIEVDQDDSVESIKSRVISMPEVQKRLDKNEIKKFIYIPNKIVSIVI